MPWVEGDGLTPSNLNNTVPSWASGVAVSDGTLTALAYAYSSETSLGLQRSAASHLALSYGTFTASGLSASNVRGSTLSMTGEIASGTGFLLRANGYINYKQGATDLWMAGLNLGAYTNELVIQDRSNLNTGMFVLQSGAGFSIGQAAQHARSATSGFIYVSSTTDAPTGTPNAMTGKIPLFYDTGNNALWAYNGSWRSVTFV